tara:strand:- start:3243 stop:3464 length:222 start_codon:yes stop_codon:yes gene_type:complete
MIKNKITELFKDNLENNFMFLFYNHFLKIQLTLVRLLGFEPRTSWSVAKRSIQLSYKRTVATIEYILKISIVV